jgi:hypothetical protein
LGGRGARTGKIILAESGEAQALALCAKHFSLDPYELWNVGVVEIPPHPEPRAYRTLLYAMAYWIEDKDRGETALLAEAMGAEVKMPILLDTLSEGD